MNGYIALHRKIMDWGWYKDEGVKSMFLHLLLKANHQPSTWRGINISRGQLITGRRVLASELGISEQNVRTRWNKLKSTNEITIKSTSEFSLITIVNYDLYQIELTNKSTKVLTNNQPTTNQRLTTNNNDNKEKKGERGTHTSKFPTTKTIRDSPTELDAIAKKYRISKAYLTLQLDKIDAYFDAHPQKKMRDARATLVNWVLSDIQRDPKVMQNYGLSETDILLNFPERV